MTPPAIAAIVGPTASGKTKLALALAERLPLEVISADSRQVYRGMDIGTAKPSAAERDRVPHHLVDVVDPDETFTVAEWVTTARALIPRIAARGRLPLVVGGTGLYVSALLDGFDFDAQAFAPETRARLARELAAGGLPPLAARLTELAPQVAAQTDLHNPRRVLRALERAESGDTGRPLATPYAGTVRVIGLRLPPGRLAARIEARARAMFAGGLPEETRRLLDAGYSTGLVSMSGHGYPEAVALLAGTMTLSEAVATTVHRVRQYAKRQLTWFRRDQRINWLSEDEGDPVEAALRVLRSARRSA